MAVNPGSTAFAAESVSGEANCHVSRNGSTPLGFVGQLYFCDLGGTRMHGSISVARDTCSLSGALGPDGSGCGPDSTCCSFNNPPWFYKQLPSPTSDDIEMRVCRDEGRSNEGIALSSYMFIEYVYTSTC
jgi:hypothetical protein